MKKKTFYSLFFLFLLFCTKNTNVYAIGEDESEAECEYEETQWEQVVEHQEGHFEFFPESEVPTIEDLENKEYEPEVEYDFCQENPTAPSCQPPPTHTDKVGGDFDLTEEERKDMNSPYYCEDENGVELYDGKCEKEQKDKIKDKLENNGFYCVNSVTVEYKDMGWKITDSRYPGYKMYAKKSGDLVVGFYLWNETVDEPIFMHYELNMISGWGGYGYNENVSHNGIDFGKKGIVDYERAPRPNSLRYDIFVTNIDNSSARYYGKYHLLWGLTEDGSVYKNHPKGQEIVLTSRKTDGLGTNVAKVVPYQDDRWRRSFAFASVWTCTWMDDYGGHIQHATPYKGNNFGGSCYNLSYYFITDNVATKVTESGKSVFPFPYSLEFSFVWADDIIVFNEGNTNENSPWGDVAAKKALNDNSIVYGDTRRGEIIVHITNAEGEEPGTWVWEKHRQQNELSAYLTLAPEVNYVERNICIGKYDCDCEDIDVECSCEYEETGCSQDIGCPAGEEDCCSEEADGSSGDPKPNDYGIGATKPVLNDLGLTIPSGGIGGVTGCGEADYVEQYIDAGSTLLN